LLGKFLATPKGFKWRTKLGVDGFVPRTQAIDFERLLSCFREIVKYGQRFGLDSLVKIEAILHRVIKTTERLEHVIAEVLKPGVDRNLVTQLHKAGKGVIQCVLIGKSTGRDLPKHFFAHLAVGRHQQDTGLLDRKSTRLNSSHVKNS